jgi:hypothetical protein
MTAMEDELVARFRAYIAAFNARDYVRLVDFYDPEVQLIIGNGTVMRGRQAIVDFYTGVNDATTRQIEILQAWVDGNVLAAEIQSEFLALRDAPDFASGPMRRGDRYYLNSFALYEFGPDRRYTRVRAAVFRREWRRLSPPPAQ